MDNRQSVIAIVIVIVVVSTTMFSIYYEPGITSTQILETSALETCKSIIYNGEGKVNILIFSDKDTATSYADDLLLIEPFKKNKDAFNFYYVDSYTPSCELYKGIALLCYSKELIKKAASCPDDYIVVIQDSEQKIRSSAYMNVVSLNSKHPHSVFAHEIGHAFANLAEEYTPSAILRNSQNCASSCADFEDGEGCFKGCSDDNYYRSIDAGIMRTLSSKSYGSFDESLIESRITKSLKMQTITARAVYEPTSCENEQYYLIENNFINGSITSVSTTIEQGCLGGNGIGSFNYSLIFENGSSQHFEEFNGKLIYTDEQGEQQTVINGGAFEKEGVFYLRVPLMDGVKSIEISTEKGTIRASLEGRGARPCRI